MKINTSISFWGIHGKCGKLDVFLGFAPARTLFTCSFADILNEDTGQGYQRPKNLSHSRNFKHYISQPNTSTIPLTFNLRPNLSKYWHLDKTEKDVAKLTLNPKIPCLAQLDCLRFGLHAAAFPCVLPVSELPRHLPTSELQFSFRHFLFF